MGGLPGFLTLLNMLANFIERLYIKHKLVIETAGFVSNQLSIAVLISIAPEVFNRSQRHHQCAWANQNNAAVIGIAHHFRVLIECQHKRRFYGDKNKHKIETVNAIKIFVILAAKPFNMATERIQMLAQTLLLFILILSVKIAFIIDQTDFGIDYNVAPFGQMDNHIWIATLT